MVVQRPIVPYVGHIVLWTGFSAPTVVTGCGRQVGQQEYRPPLQGTQITDTCVKCTHIQRPVASVRVLRLPNY
jgi:hypothetical protein